MRMLKKLLDLELFANNQLFETGLPQHADAVACKAAIVYTRHAERQMRQHSRSVWHCSGKSERSPGSYWRLSAVWDRR